MVMRSMVGFLLRPLPFVANENGQCDIAVMEEITVCKCQKA